MKLRAFNVYLNSKWIDCIFYSSNDKITAQEVRTSLINHDGYDPGISVRERKGNKHPREINKDLKKALDAN